ncbi:hypothetical protein [Streptomyces sp. NPDC058304]|uniref:hypothetical protein n=1 Tax=Streptomyces sp. NPDC058304 TaxID=3346437 RepID=UPI0036E3E547
MRGERGVHNLIVQAGIAVAAAEHESEAAGFGEQVPAVEAAVHHEGDRGDVDGRQGDVDNLGDPGPDPDNNSGSALALLR